MKRSRLLAISLFVGCSWALSAGCSADSGDDNGSGSLGGAISGPFGGSAGSGSMMVAGTSGNGGSAMATLNPLCGVADPMGDCVPDNAGACRNYVPPLGMGGADTAGEPGSAGESSGGQAGQNAGAGGAPAAAGQAGAPFADGGFGADGGQGNSSSAGAGGEGGAAQVAPPPLAAYSCQVTSQNNLLTRQCLRAGSGSTNAPCFGSADCAPGFACVTDGDAGRCLPYCCDSTTTCASGSYCAEQPLRRAQANTSNAAPRVPVCVPADGCSLEDPFPCPNGAACRCASGTACMVVRPDGTTACVQPGTGQQGDACPCAWNHICSSVTHTCVKVCRTDSDADCGAQKCQASAELPPNFGVCVGPVNQ